MTLIYAKPFLLHNDLKNVNIKSYCSNYNDISLNIYGLRCGTSLSFWKNNGWITSIDPGGWFGFSGILGIGWVEDCVMMRGRFLHGKES